MVKKDINGRDITPVCGKELAEHLRCDGRNLYTENGIIFGWENASFEFCGEFEGEISMDVEIVNTFYVDVMHRTVFYVVVDGAARKTEPFTDEAKNIVLCRVEKGFHTVKVIKNTSPIYNKYTFLGLRYNGVMGDRLPARKRIIEFVGDSISAGACAASYENEQGKENLDLDTSTDAYLSYPAIVGRHFDADVYNISIPGVGVVNKEGIFETNSPMLYDYTKYYHDKELAWDHSACRPDVIVIALGTNDKIALGTEKDDEYEPAARNYLRHIRRMNPDSYIIWAYGMMFDFTNFDPLIKRIVEEENDGRMKYVRMPSDNGGGYDHPGIKGHAEFARILIEEIEKYFGNR